MSRIPLPQSLDKECIKSAKILNSFVNPGKGADKYIPPSILERAKGVAFMTVLKAGFIWSGRFGFGLVIARLPDGRWSAPSAIGTAGAGVGGQIGAEVTDFVMVLTTDSAVKAFTHGGNVTLGTNLTVAAGPFGRSAEASGAIINLAPVLSYSKSKGLFAGVSLEGSVIIERKDANAAMYGRPVRAQELLNGTMHPPPQADVLYRALDLKATPLGTPGTMGTPAYGAASSLGSSFYGASPAPGGYGAASSNSQSPVGAAAAGPGPLGGTSSYLNSSITSTGHKLDSGYVSRPIAHGAADAGSSTSGYGANAGASTGYGANAGASTGYGANAGASTSYGAGASDYGYGTNPPAAGYGAAAYGAARNAVASSSAAGPPSTYGENTATFGAAPPYQAADAETVGADGNKASNYYSPPVGDSKRPPPPPPPTARKQRVVALYDFAGEQEGDLPFKKGDIIIVSKSTESTDDWWTGDCNGKHGSFPANYTRAN